MSKLMIITYTTLILSSTITFSPLMMGALLLSSATLLALMMTVTMFTWPAMILFMVYVGGLMVMLSYFLSTQPNQAMKSTPEMLSLPLNMGLLLILLHTPSFLPPVLTNIPAIAMILLQPALSLLTILILALLMSLIVVVTMTKSEGALRPFSPH